MSTYLEGSAQRPRRLEVGPPAERPQGRREGPSLLAIAGRELWRRTLGGSVERMPDPARHPECWFRFI